MKCDVVEYCFRGTYFPAIALPQAQGFILLSPGGRRQLITGEKEGRKIGEIEVTSGEWTAIQSWLDQAKAAEAAIVQAAERAWNTMPPRCYPVL